MAANGYEPVIGLEIHVQLSTKTKMFCGCALSFGDEPNVHTCPVCLGHPGALPTTNEQAIRYGLMIAAALECEVAPRSVFAPSLKATVGEVGVTTKSKRSNAFEKSSAILVRTRCARP